MAKILGIDEVGRGPLAGPLVVGAVVLPEWTVEDGEYTPEWVGELRDSKKIGARKRERLAATILEEAPAVGLGWVSPAEIDDLGIMDALRLATRRAVKEAQKNHARFTEIIIDGNVNYLSGTALGPYTTTVIKGDDKIKEVSAASIVAKVARDRYMIEQAAVNYPGYGFESHVGYGTKAHKLALKKLGICPEHRLSFEPCKSMVGFSRAAKKLKETTEIGRKAEGAVARYLVEEKGHELIAQNYKTPRYEVDIISCDDKNIYFTEVKYRKDDERGGGFAAIGRNKRKQMKFAAECFMHDHPEYFYDPKLAVAAVSGAGFEIEDWFPLDTEI